MDKQYKKALKIAEANLADFKERGETAIGGDAIEFIESLLTPEEVAAVDLRVEIMLEITRARREQGISQKKLEEITGVKQQMISRMEKGYESSQIDTLLKVLLPLGKTLSVVDLDTARPK
jgi:predicted XRE-type DNA-binding protein